MPIWKAILRGTSRVFVGESVEIQQRHSFCHHATA